MNSLSISEDSQNSKQKTNEFLEEIKGFRQKSMNSLGNFKNSQNVTPQRTHRIKYAAGSPSRHLIQVARAFVHCTGLPDEFACCIPRAVNLSPRTDWRCLVT